ncbi:unnamed protein product [Pseudo-nitzschia multistriata]|uniref:Uncharacterized protein n=1 Tax=Pseudo-nitzschia multistriata TaxID=183589 RepID=A0A448ZHY4_9STRA|nr:unnamed protein product [Pseudo-nitzschia multistriata]
MNSRIPILGYSDTQGTEFVLECNYATGTVSLPRADFDVVSFAMGRTVCLGSRAVTVEKTADSSGSTEAAILVSVEDVRDGNHRAVAVRLSTGTAAYRCVLLPSETAAAASDCLEGLVSAGDGNGNSDGNSDGDGRVLALGRLLLRGDGGSPCGHEKEDEHEDSPRTQNRNRNQHRPPSDGLGLVFQSEERRRTPGRTPEGPDHGDGPDDVFLAIQETVANGMKRSVFRKKMEPTDVLSYCRFAGKALNRSLEDAERTKEGMLRWKKTAETLGRVQQETKDTLLANFARLRNRAHERHRAELSELSREHRAPREADSWSAPATTERTDPAGVHPADDEAPGPDDDHDDQALGLGLALAEGKRLRGEQPPRTAVLAPGESVDMVGLSRESRAFEDDRKGGRNRKRGRTGGRR